MDSFSITTRRLFVEAKGREVMLVLSRQRDESLMIGDNVEVKIVDIRGEKVRLGVTAPKDQAVHRKEVYAAIRRDQGKVDSLPVLSLTVREQLLEKATWLSSHHLPFVMVDGQILAVEDFGKDYIVLHYRPGVIDGRETLGRESLFSTNSRNEALAAMLNAAAELTLQPDDAMQIALYSAFQALAKDCDARQSRSDVPAVPAKAS